jgi:hypothetical protein
MVTPKIFWTATVYPSGKPRDAVSPYDFPFFLFSADRWDLSTKKEDGVADPAHCPNAVLNLLLLDRKV